MEFLMVRRGLQVFSALALSAIILSGCGSRFHHFKSSELERGIAGYHNVPPDANQRLEGTGSFYDSLLYVRKLNGGLGGQVVGTDSFIVVPSYNERIYFLDPHTGKEITSLMTESTVGSAVALADSLIYFVEEAGADRLTCFNMVKGKPVFQVVVVDAPGAPIIDGDDLYITARTGKVYRINRWTGKTIWTYDTKNHIYCSPTVDSGHVYVGTDRGEILALDRKLGTRVWSFRTSGAIFARPVIDRYLYCPSGDGILYSLDPAHGKIIWSFTTQGAIHTTPTLVKGKIVFGSDDKSIYCLDAASGASLWSFETDAIVQSSPIATESTFIVCNSAGSVYQASFDGAVMKSRKIKGSIMASPVVIANKLFVVTRSRQMYCFGPSTAPSATAT
jgi:outer membrane protein assembly factor BamB